MPDSGKIRIIDTDDWVWVFRGDDNVYEGHSIDPSMLLDALGIDHETFWVEDPEDGYALANLCHDPNVTPKDFERFRV